ncbi:hypothetical protein YC2023_082208 [Brassica napus]
MQYQQIEGPTLWSHCWGNIFHEEITPASGFQVPAPMSGSLPPGLGPCLQPPASRPSDLSCLRINGNLPLIRSPAWTRGKEEGSKTSITRAHQFYSRQGKVSHLEDHLLRHVYNRRIPAITVN